MRTITKTYYETTEFGDFPTSKVIEHIHEDSRIVALELELASTKKMLDEALGNLEAACNFLGQDSVTEKMAYECHYTLKNFLAKHEKKEGVNG